MKKMYWKIKAFLLGSNTAFDQKIVIEIGLNANSNREAREEAEQIRNIIAIKLEDYLKQFPCRIYVK